ncbi:alpha-mannosidase [Lacticaseibacillus mingshuiensis]|uniref:Alpha-mannosidase n=1 Tax=Lacticaseibacillus mingshuiensis TaxID=2799574 RepID=A0ABW4CHU3_9LACO|nr:alpha-mannosidase [Lacticaseibacillus mingshuiensis]
MAKKKVFIVSHAHWDREWYMGFEKHHMRLISLMDDLFYLFKHDPDFNSFHLDGQTIILDDYLAVRPEKREELEQYVREGKLKVGPFYILQDDFLISPETNVRNTQYGKKQASEWSQPVPLGYFPDTFGNMGQTAQMMQLSKLDTVAFGRGVTPTGLNNQVGQGKFDSTFSEMWWEGPDKSKVLGILFANWYSNGNEIPVDEDEAKVYWTKKLADAEKFASTPDLLFMNGVDHQPVQMDVTKAIKVANKLFPDYEFIHSNWPDYIKALKADLPKDLSTIEGELTSQATDGWYTLANTASSRVYLKQENTLTERTLENQVEPLLYLGGEATAENQDRLDFAWKMKLRNNPHDSICGCSVDPVHQRMMTRFHGAQQVAEVLSEHALTSFTNSLDTHNFPADSHPFVLINTSGAEKHEDTTVEVEIARAYFKDGAPQAQYDKMVELGKNLPELTVIDAVGEKIAAKITNPHARFNYDLPDRTFREPYMALYVDVDVAATLRPFGWQSFAVIEGAAALDAAVSIDGQTLRNARLAVTLEADGTVTVTDQATGHEYRDAVDFEDVGDMGNEYIFRQSADKLTFTAKDAALSDVAAVQTAAGAQLSYTLTYQLPSRAAASLDYEREAVIDITNRKSVRGSELQPLALHVTLTLAENSNKLAIHVTGDNQLKDHRLRALFNTDLTSETNDSESIFEVVARPNKVGKNWRNPTNPQHQQAFSTVHDDTRGVVVGNFGLNEYEVTPDGSQIAVTFLRCVGEMGDWGYFATPEAQCLGDFHADLSVAFTDGSEAEQLAAYQAARAAQIPVIFGQTGVHAGEKAPSNTYLDIEGDAFAVTATKMSQDHGLIVRGYNMTGESQPLTVLAAGKDAATLADFDGDAIAKPVNSELAPAEIRTYQFK